MDTMQFKAIAFAAEYHGNQFRKRSHNGVRLPYITHPLDVLKTIWSWGTVSPDMACAAALHDVMEDCGVADGQLFDEFNANIAHLVAHLTFRGGDKGEYLASFADKPVEALVIKLADRFCNVRDFMQDDPRYADKYYGKAEPLLVALETRAAEVEKEWGEEAMGRIREDRNRLEADLRKAYYSLPPIRGVWSTRGRGRVTDGRYD